MDDSTLASQAAAGDAAAFELLVRRHTDAVWRTAYGMLRDRTAAEDAVQDAFLKAYRSIGGFKGASSFRTWLLSITHTTCIDALRRSRPEVASLDEARTERRRDVEASTRAALGMAIEGLEGAEREAFLLVDVLGLSREEAARIANVPASTLKSRLARAHERLLAGLDDTGTVRARRKR